jgi:hypothetical protein
LIAANGDACCGSGKLLLMELKLPSVGSKWRAQDRRGNRTIEVVRYDITKRRVRIHCIETETLSWAKPERFNGKSSGYTKVPE